MINESDTAVLNRKTNYLINKLEKEYFDRHEYWSKNLPESEMKNEMVNLSFKPAEEFYTIVDKEFIPAIRNGNKQKAKELVTGVLEEKYLEHRQHIDKVTALANDYCSRIEVFAKNKAENRTLILVIIGITAIVTSILFFSYVMSAKITLPLKKLQKASEQIGEGDYNINLQVSSEDEIGFLSDTFNKMTLKLKKQTEELEKEKTRRLSSLIDGQDMERQRISRELHDGLGQNMIAIKLKLENIINILPPEARGSVVQVEDMFDGTIEEIKNISDNLMPSILKEFGVETALEYLCQTISETSGLEIIFDALPMKFKLDEKISTYLYRISQEALNNIVKHAEATSATLQLVESENYIELIVEDNGKGFKFGQDFRTIGNGIYNMRERTRILGGTFELSSNEGSGTNIIIKIPLHES
jgi:signal transduction histidine kinase